MRRAILLFGWRASFSFRHRRLQPARFLVRDRAPSACFRSSAWFDLDPSGRYHGVRVSKERACGLALPSPVSVYGDGRAMRADGVLRLTEGGADGRA